MKKVCHLTSVHQYNDVRIFVKECSSLAKVGYDTYLVALDCDEQLLNDVKIVSAGQRARNRLVRITKNVWQVYKKALEVNADIYHFHDPELMPVGLLLKRKGKKVIFDIHEDLPKQILSKHYINKKLRKVLATTIEQVENYAAKRFDAVIAVYEKVKKRLDRFNSEVYIINNYPVLKELYYNPYYNDKKQSICYTGGITKARGIEYVVKSLEKVNREIEFFLAGGYSPSDFRDELIKIEGWRKVKEFGFVSRKDVADILCRSKAGIITFLPVPHHIEANPNKIFEYMAAGLPVIASDFPYWRSLIEKYQCAVFVDPENPDAIAGAINYLLSHDEEAKAMGERGRKAVENEFNWEMEEKKLLDIYSSL